LSGVDCLYPEANGAIGHVIINRICGAGTLSAEVLDLFVVKDAPRAVVDAIFDYHEHKSFEPSAQEQEKLLEL
jgi:hypothetical protein